MGGWVGAVLCGKQLQGFLPTKSCPALCEPMDYILPRSSDHGIFQARILEWVAIPVFLPGKSHGQRSLDGYSPWVCTESDTTK